jgi:hypothetical protein
MKKFLALFVLSFVLFSACVSKPSATEPPPNSVGATLESSLVTSTAANVTNVVPATPEARATTDLHVTPDTGAVFINPDQHLDAVYLRIGPSTMLDVVATLKPGDTARLIGENSDWLLVDFKGQKLWVYAPSFL